MTNTTPLLEVTDLRLRLRTHAGTVDAVRGVSFTLRRGETLGLVGRIGLRQVAHRHGADGTAARGRQRLGQPALPRRGNDRAKRGRAGAPCAATASAWSSRSRCQRSTRCTPSAARWPSRCACTAGLTAAAARKEAVALLDRVGIADAARRFDAWPHQFSGGQRQRITIAMALACGPDLLIADEPTTALDVTIAGQILQLIRDLVRERGMGLILISHDLGVIAQNVEPHDGDVRRHGGRKRPDPRSVFPPRPPLHAGTVWFTPATRSSGAHRERRPGAPGGHPRQRTGAARPARRMPLCGPLRALSLPACQGEMPRR